MGFMKLERRLNSARSSAGMAISWEDGIERTRVKDLTLVAADAVYVNVLEALIVWIKEKSGHEVRKPAEVSVGSVYNYLNEIKKSAE